MYGITPASELKQVREADARSGQQARLSVLVLEFLINLFDGGEECKQSWMMSIGNKARRVGVRESGRWKWKRECRPGWRKV